MLGALRRTFPPTIRQLLSSSASKQSPQSPTEVCGWVKSIRRQKNVSFAVVSDGSSTKGLQAVFRNDTIPAKLTNGCSVKLLGELVESRGAKQDKEFRVETAEVVGECDPETYPIQKQALTTEYLRDQCHLRGRVDKIGAMLRVRDSLTRGMHEYLQKQGFMHVHTPIITASDCEGAGEAFSVTTTLPSPHLSPSSSSVTGNTPTSSPSSPDHFFRTPAYLTVSSQLHLEALAHSHSRVYTLSPAFRAEKSQTGRHLAEFWMLEAEWTFVRDVEGLCDVVEDMLRSVVCGTLEEIGADEEGSFAFGKSGSDDKAEQGGSEVDSMSLKDRVTKTFNLDGEWTRIRYEDAIALLHKASYTHTFEFEPTLESGLQSEHEKYLAEHFNGPVFVTHYPASQKPFYMRSSAPPSPTSTLESSANTIQTVECFDLIIPTIGELIGGSLREERLSQLTASMASHALLGRPEYEWYRDLRRYGGAPHGGFGMGLERLVSAVCGIANVRECVAMPRWAGRMLL